MSGQLMNSLAEAGAIILLRSFMEDFSEILRLACRLASETPIAVSAQPDGRNVHPDGGDVAASSVMKPPADVTRRVNEAVDSIR